MQKKKQKKSNGARGNAASQLKNFARGQVGAVNSHAYEPTFVDRRSGFENGIREATLFAGRHLLPSQHHQFLTWLGTQSKLITNPSGRKRVVSYRGLSNRYDTEQADFDKQVSWSISRVQFESQKISQYKESFAELESFILFGKTVEAQQTIQRIEENFGATVRLAEVKLAFEQFYFGLEAQKKLATRMRGGRQAGLIGFLIHYMSMRNEPSMPVERHNKILSERISVWTPGAFKDYANFKLLKIAPLTEEAIANVLRIEEAHSIFDLHDTIESIHAASADSSLAVRKFHQILEARNFKVGPPGARPSQNDLGYFLGPSIRRGYQRILRNLKELPGQISLENIKILSVYAAALRDKPKRSQSDVLLISLVHRIAEHLNLFVSGVSRNSEIAKLSSNFSQLPLFGEVSRLVQTKRLNWLDPWLSADAGLRRHARQLQEDDTPVNGSCSTTLRRAAIWRIRLGSDRRSETLARFAAFALKSYKPSRLHFIDANVKLALCKSLIELEEFSPVWDLISSLFLDNYVQIENIPVVGILRNGKWQEISKNASLAKLAICIDIQSSDEDAEIFDGLKRYALEDLLEQLKVDRPSRLTESDVELSRKEYIYFLRNICTPRTMELLPALSGTALINAERRAICSMLLQIDREHASEYNQEILNTIRRERVQQGLKLVDGSRIHVDTDVLAKKLGKELSIDFDRYKRLVNAGVGVAVKFDEVLRNAVKPVAEQELLTIPENEADDLLLQIIGAIRDRFLFDEMNGFDSYLGRRVRHNSMTGTMRAPLSQERLTTNFDSPNGRYESNDYWLKKLGGELTGDQLQRLDAAFDQFSSSFDAVGNDIKTRLFQVRTVKFPDGIFYISLNSNAYHLLRSLAQQNITIEEFVISCFHGFWGNLSESLSQARHIIRHDARNKIEEAFSLLKAKIGVFEATSLIDLTASIERSRHAVHKQLELIVEWFYKREINEQKSIWRLDEIIDICIEVCLVTHRARNPDITLDVSGDISLASESLFVLSDILWVAIDNACMHSGFASEVPVRLVVNYDNAAKRISLDIENDVSAAISDDAWHNNIASITKDIETRRANESLRVEGRSGLKKVAAIAFSVKGGSCTFGPRENGSAFGISVTIPTVEFDVEALDNGDEADDADEMDEALELQPEQIA